MCALSPQEYRCQPCPCPSRVCHRLGCVFRQHCCTSFRNSRPLLLLRKRHCCIVSCCGSCWRRFHCAHLPFDPSSLPSHYHLVLVASSSSPCPCCRCLVIVLVALSLSRHCCLPRPVLASSLLLFPLVYCCMIYSFLHKSSSPHPCCLSHWFIVDVPPFPTGLLLIFFA